MKRIIALILVLVITFPATAYANIKNTLLFDGKESSSDIPVYMKNGYAMAPMRRLSELMGVTTEWDANAKSVTATKDETVVVVAVSSATAYVDEAPKKMPVATEITDNTVFVPLNFMASAFGYEANWFPDTQTIEMKSPSVTGSQKVNMPWESRYEEDLDVETAYNRAIKENTDLRLYDKTIEDYNEQKKSLMNDLQSVSPNTPVDDIYVTNTRAIQLQSEIRRINSTIDQAAITKEIAEGNIMYNVRSAFAQIESAQRSIVLASGQIELSKRSLDIQKVMADIGMVSSTDYEKAKTAHEQLEQSQTINERTLEVRYLDLNRLLNYEADKRYNVIIEREYTPLPSDFSLESHISSQTTKDPNVRRAKENLDQAERNLTYYNPSGGSSYSQLQTAISSASLDFQDAKLNLEKSLRTAYENLRSLETQISSAEFELERVGKAEGVARVQFEVGNITELQLLQAIQAVESAELNIDSLKAQHDLQLFTFSNPYLIR